MEIIGSLSLSARLLGLGMSLSSILQFWPTIGVIALICLVAGIIWFLLSAKHASKPLAVQRKSRLLSASQCQFFEALVDALSDEFFIFTRVGMRGVVEHRKGSSLSEKRRASKQIENGYFDFVLCRKLDMSIFAVIDLQNFDGKSKRLRLKREALLSRVCDGAGIKLFYFDIRQDYKSKDIARLITGRSKNRRGDEHSFSVSHASQLSVDTLSQTVTGHRRTCPKCRSEVVTKVAMRGARIGEKFLMCRKYPYCDYRISSNDENITKLEQEERRKGEIGGFKNWS